LNVSVLNKPSKPVESNLWLSRPISSLPTWTQKTSLRQQSLTRVEQQPQSDQSSRDVSLMNTHSQEVLASPWLRDACEIDTMTKNT
jgi:hypothetical protein